MKWLVRLQIFGVCDILTEEKKKSMFREKADWVELISIQRVSLGIFRKKSRRLLSVAKEQSTGSSQEIWKMEEKIKSEEPNKHCSI